MRGRRTPGVRERRHRGRSRWRAHTERLVSSFTPTIDQVIREWVLMSTFRECRWHVRCGEELPVGDLNA